MSKYSLTSYEGYLYVRYTHKKSRFVISANLQSENLLDPLECKLNRRHPDFLKAKRITDLIMNNMITASQRVMNAGFEPTVPRVRKKYFMVLDDSDPLPDQPDYPDFYERWHEFMKIKATELRYDGFRNYTQLYDLLREFEAEENYQMDFHTFNEVMFGRLKKYMFLVKRYQDATTDKHITKLRSFYKWAVPRLDRSFLKFAPKIPNNVHPLEPDELHIVINAELNGYLDKARDLFVFCSCTGMRYSDSQRFDRSWIGKGIIAYSQRKTSGEALVPLLETAKKILMKYGCNTPKISNSVFNRFLKDLFKQLEITRLVRIQESNAGKVEEKMLHFWQQASSHTARKTFITYALYRGIPLQDVMKMSGHSDYREMKPYIAISREHIREQAKKFDL